MSKEVMELARKALVRIKNYGNTFAYRSNEQNPYEQVCEAISAIEALAEQKSGIKQVIELYDSPDQPSQQEPVAMVLPPVVEPTTKSKPVYIMGSYVGTGEVSSVTFGGVSFAGNGTAGRESDVRPTGKWIQAKDTVKGDT